MKRQANAFTLIELLVVIFIIALLVGILLPALAKARETAKNMLCLTNQKQITFAVLNYAADQKNYFPKLQAGSTGTFIYETHRDVVWDDYLGVGGYDGRQITTAQALATHPGLSKASELYFCPTSDQVRGTDDRAQRFFIESNVATRSYSLNAGENNTWAAGVEGIAFVGQSSNEDQIAEPSATILLTHSVWVGGRQGNRAALYTAWDATNGQITNGVRQYFGRHLADDTGNYAFADGHAVSMSVADTFTSTTDNMWDRY